MYMNLCLTAFLVLILTLPCPGQPTAGANAAQQRIDLGKKALAVVAGHLKDANSDIRAQAATVLGAAGNKAAAGVLGKMLQDRDKYVRIAAAHALWELGSTAGLKTIYEILKNVPDVKGAESSPLAALKIISRNKIREKALETLAAMRGPKAAETLVRMKDDDFGPIRDTAARELARLGRTEELARFVDALASEDEALRYESASALSRICAGGVTQGLLSLLETEKAVRVRLAALDAIKCDPGKKAAAAQLLKLADDANPAIKYKAITALAGIKDDTVKSKLGAIAADTTDIRLKLAAHSGLIAAGAKGDVAVPERGYEAISPEVRIEALELLESFSPEEAQPLLTRAIDDENVRVKLTAARQIITRFSKK
ncbi:MAG: hypothetical protein A2234_05300 [Elusimicrobia bacterium RIFOXYA2_FULL_58_8]|nr:MAG: hypothetical protein A2285_01960 [Elusimicrobia bacterium RIFOXYA12_FULL_57_11]OGS15884.1 MAG: hypothetical protein A2234_05300 [Elusimicrobia bacterium RIFOXYA2_FULL_58_8]